MPRTHLLDTSVYSQPVRRAAHPAVTARWQGLDKDAAAISSVCEAEVLYGLKKHGSDRMRVAYDSFLGEVLGLKKEAQDDLAELLKKTPLASIIQSAKIVANRLDFLAGLENLLFDKDTKKTLLERDQIPQNPQKKTFIF